MSVKKIVVVGPESTGKSYLTKQLAEYFNGIAVEEYAREYLHKNGTDYSFENLWDIAQGQIRNEEEGLQLAQASNPQANLFIDTDMYVMKVWGEFVFGQCDNRILSLIAERKYDLYLLCSPDIPWIKDEMREYPDLETRNTLFYHYKDLLVQQSTPFTIVQGDYEKRFQVAVNAVKQII